MSRGEYLQFLDADDLLRPAAVEFRIGAFEQGIGSVYGRRQYMNRNGKVLSTRAHVSPYVREGGLRQPGDIVFTRIGTMESLHRREWVCRVGGFDENLPQSQDADLHLRLELAGCVFAHEDLVMGYIRAHDWSNWVSKARWWESDPGRHIEITHHWMRLVSTTIGREPDEAFRRGIADRLYGWVRDAAAGGQWTVVHDYHEDTLRLAPDYRREGIAGVVCQMLGLKAALVLNGYWSRARRLLSGTRQLEP